MRLHLVIQRHGLPVTRILWTTSPPSLYANNAASSSSQGIPAASSAIASTRLPNAAFSNGGYTIAQLLEDLNEVVPLETEPGLFDQEYSGQWGLEDYAVEVGGSECLHFMEVEGLLRDGDEVVIRALQIADLRVRRISGRHQISGDGRHLIDGVPFGKPFLKRPTSSRPAITIPPRKKRRTLFSGWDSNAGYEEEDTEWAPAGQGALGEGTGISAALLNAREKESEEQDDDYADNEDEYEDVDDAHEDTYEDAYQGQEEGDGTVIHHIIEQNKDSEASESEADLSEFKEEEEDLENELKDLKEDLEASEIPETGGRPKHTVPDDSFAPSFPTTLTIEEDTPRRKSVRFKSQKSEEPATPPRSEPDLVHEETTTEIAFGAGEKSNDSSNAVSSDSESDSDDSDSSSSSSDDDTSSSSDDSDSEADSVSEPARIIQNNPPGQGSLRTRKSNQRNKKRRRLSRLKELGILSPQADFIALRKWEESNGDVHVASVDTTPGQPTLGQITPAQATPTQITPSQKRTKDQEQADFEAKRQKLLRDLASGGVAVDAFPEKENLPPSNEKEITRDEDSGVLIEDQSLVLSEPASEPSKKPKLDVSSTRRLLFGSLGVKTPKSKEDEESTRKKLAGNNNHIQLKSAEEAPDEESGSDSEVDWESKLVVRATECVFNDIVLSAPPFPFEQRWDRDAHEIIKERNGWGKKKRRRKRKTYDEYEYEEAQENEDESYYNGEDSYFNGEDNLNYDDTAMNCDNSELPVKTSGEKNELEQTSNEISEETAEDLPPVPTDVDTVRDLVENEAKKGVIIAFKQLDMSKETNWQPRVSEYRVAEITDVHDQSVFIIRLAKRDRRQKKEADDEEDGSRAYSGFEMPGFDDDDQDDDGYREVCFVDLQSPKLLREAPKSSHSLVVEESVPIPDPSAIEVEQTDAPIVEHPEPEPESSRPESQSQDVGMTESETLDAPPAEPAAEPDQPRENDVHGQTASSPVKSPEFTGFETSRQGDIKGSPKREVRDTTPGETTDKETNNDESTSVRQDAQKNDPLPHDFDDDIYPAVNFDDDLEIISNPEALKSFNKDMDELFGEKKPTRWSPEPKKEKPSQEPERPSSRSSGSSEVPNPFYEVDKAYAERQAREKKPWDKSVVESEIDTSMPPLSSPIANETPPSAQLPVTSFPESPSPKETQDRNVTPKSSASASLLRRQSPDHKSHANTRPPPSSAPGAFEKMASSSHFVTTRNCRPATEEGDQNTSKADKTPRGRPVQKNSRIPVLSPTKKPHPREPSPLGSIPESSQQPKQEPATQPPPASQMSEIVDLTQSSPPASPGGSDDDYARSQRHPRWVQKNIPGTGRRTRQQVISSTQTMNNQSISPPPRRWQRPGRK